MNGVLVYRVGLKTLKDAVESGKAYQTRLDPPPADERVAHIFRVVDKGS